MGTHGWGTKRTVAQTLFKEGHRFEFFQAVRLLEKLGRREVSIGRSSEPEIEAVRFKSRVSFEFPASDIQQIRPGATKDDPVEMTVNLMGLAGAHGPLPAPYAELLLERTRHKDTALRDFLDIFNHRLISLLYRLRRIYRIGYDGRSPDQTHFVRYLYALMGLGTPGLRNRLRVNDRALLFYTALLGQKPRSMTGLETILSHYFQTAVTSRQLCGLWHRIEPDQYTRLGLTGCNQILGYSAILGTRLWDQQGRFELWFKGLQRPQFDSFLPPGDVYIPLSQLTRFYVGRMLEFDFILELNPQEVPGTRLEASAAPRLGWNTWLGGRSKRRRPGRVRLSPRLLSRKYYPRYLLDAMGIDRGNRTTNSAGTSAENKQPLAAA